jgi:5-methylthioadenosine/S-adenosylhomocysteine deaminase
VPLYDLYAQIVYALKGGDVETVVIGRRPVMRDRRVLTLDEATIIARAREYGVRIKRSLPSPGK